MLGTPVAPRTASIRQRPASGRITAAELEELFQRQAGAAPDMYATQSLTFNYLIFLLAFTLLRREVDLYLLI
jgi:hypothetical protein